MTKEEILNKQWEKHQCTTKQYILDCMEEYAKVKVEEVCTRRDPNKILDDIIVLCENNPAAKQHLKPSLKKLVDALENLKHGSITFNTGSMVEKIRSLKKENITADDDLHDAGWNGAINEVLKILR